MLLQQLNLLNYKNISELSLSFNTRINCFTGKNGVGKSNILDAIYHLSFTKSYFNPITKQNIKHNSPYFMIEGKYLKNNKEEHILISAKKDQKKIIKRNQKIYQTYSEHIGVLPLVMISPSDSNLILEGSSVRRKFMDNVISQSDSSYLQVLIAYNRILAQRNALLKYFYLNQTFNQANLDIYNQQLHKFGTEIHKKRENFLEGFLEVFHKQYQKISQGSETVNIRYKSQLTQLNYLNLLEKSTTKDRNCQYTNIGIHRDDLKFEIENNPMSKFGSQGQQKTFLIALKFAQFAFIKSKKEQVPILLLDDIFDKLDQNRVAQLIDMVNSNHFGQVFISDTHNERTKEIVSQTQQSYTIFNIENGSVLS